uniref:Uncharacterized protein n=1 Tax=Panagrellus redivivus TaxID=6233 RepID=A0A7E4VAI4_PANRE
MMALTPLGTEIEAIIAAVLLFMISGAVMFLCCFLLTHMFLFYKHHVLKRKNHDRFEDKSVDFNYAPLEASVTASEDSFCSAI